MRPWQIAAPPLVLASASASRARLLAEAGIEALLRPSGVDEGAIKVGCRRDGRSAGDAALSLARAKALAVAVRMPGALVIGADQILSAGPVWFDKPLDLEDAARQLRAMRGRAQTLHTACVLATGDAIVWEHLAEPVLSMHDCSDRMIDWYVEAEGEALLGCVGACRIEGPGQLLIEAPGAEHATILGLPMRALIGQLRARRVLRD